MPAPLLIEHGDVILDLVPDTGNWWLPEYTLRNDVEYVESSGIKGRDGNTAVLVIPAGYVTNGASIHPMFWPIIGRPFRRSFIKAALVHDYRCDDATRVGCSDLRKMADGLFRRMLKLDGNPYWLRAVMFWAVFIWGYLSFAGIEPLLKPKVRNK